MFERSDVKDLQQRMEDVERYMVKMAQLINTNAGNIVENARSASELSVLIMDLAESNKELHDIVEEHMGAE